MPATSAIVNRPRSTQGPPLRPSLAAAGGPFFAAIGTPGRLLCGSGSPLVIGVYRRPGGLQPIGVARLRRLVRLGHYEDVSAFMLTVGGADLDGLWVVEGEEFIRVERI